MKYIAAASPEVVLGLLDRMEAALAEIADLRKRSSYWQTEYERLTEEVSKIEDEPAAWGVAEKDQCGNLVWYDCTLSSILASEFAAKHREKYGSDAEPYPLYAAAQQVNLVMLEALKEIADDYSDRFDMTSPSTNPGMKYVVKQARAAIALAEEVKP
jgi:hypothetical protein